MAPYLRKSVVSADHLIQTFRPPWIVLWDTTERSDGHWSVVRVPTEASAIESAAHFLKLGFVVHAIKDPSGVVAMDAQAITARFSRNKSPTPAYPERRRTEPEYVALTILRNFAEDRQPIPGLMVTPGLLQTQLSALALNATEFDRAVSFAADRGWLVVGDGILTLTREGCVAALG